MMKLVGGLDIGNGYVKGKVNGNDVSTIDIPSGVAVVTRTHDLKAPIGEAPGVMNDIFNQMELSFDSPLIPDKNRLLFGRRGLQSGMSVKEFDVYSHISKAKQPLSAILTLGCLAGKVILDYWNKTNALPTDTLKANVRIALALPIGEFKKYRAVYADGYKSNEHIVEMHNFEQPIKVQLRFDDVQVIAEGASAHYAIIAKGEELMNAMLNDARKASEMLEDVTAKDVLSANNVVGVDIGEGTVNFPVFQNSKFNPDVSLTYDKGYGEVLNSAMERLQDAGHAFGSRKELQDFLNTPPTALNKKRYKIIQDIVDDEITAFVNEVAMQFSKIMERAGSYLEVVYIYGGGATPVKNELYPALIEKVKSFGGGEILYPVLYLDSRYSRYLNREGLYFMAEKLASAK